MAWVVTEGRHGLWPLNVGALTNGGYKRTLLSILRTPTAPLHGQVTKLSQVATWWQHTRRRSDIWSGRSRWSSWVVLFEFLLRVGVSTLPD